MKKQNIFKYSVLAIALILSSLRLHPCLNILGIYFTCLFIAINLNKKKIIQYSLFFFMISIILKVVLNVNNHYLSENFNGKSSNHTNKEHLVSSTNGEQSASSSNGEQSASSSNGEASSSNGEASSSNGEASSNNGEASSNNGEASSNNGEASSNNGEASSSNINESLSKTFNNNNLTKEEKDKLNFTDSVDDVEKTEEFNSNDINIITPAQAQRELYRLVDTTSLLTKTMNELSPILTEGKNIMNTLEQLNLTSKLQK